MEPDNTGVYTDSAEFTHVISECTNISVGYYKEHTVMEHQDIEHLIKLCLAVVKVDWESLPVKRDQTKIEYKSYSYGNSKGFSSYDYSTKKYDSGYSTYDSWSGWDKSPARSRRRNYKKEYGYYDDYYFEDDNYKTSGKSYLNDLDSEISYERKETKNHYEALKQDLMDDRFSNEEIIKLSDQYFDFSNEEHKEGYMNLTEYKEFYSY